MVAPRSLTAPAAACEVLPDWGKSSALLWFASRLRSAHVPPSWVIPRSRWQRDGQAALEECLRFLGQLSAAVRSDARVEDQLKSSCAGHYPTELDVQPSALPAAVAHVFAALDDHPDDAVLIQPMQQNIIWTGVGSTHRIHDGAPWYCVEMSRSGVAAVTDGRANGRLRAVERAALQRNPERLHELPSELRPVLTTLQELESWAAQTPLEMEFALHEGDGSLQLCLLQVRPLATRKHWPESKPLRRSSVLSRLDQPDEHCDQVVGDDTVLSLMADWNPAELLGAHPRPLALSVFDALIGRGVWWGARARLGYQAPPDADVKLLYPVAGRPYVDVRRSANSLLPAGLPRALRRRIVQSWLTTLKHSPELHDKVEFAVYRTVRDFTDRDALIRHRPEGLSAADIDCWEQALTGLSRGLLARIGDPSLSRHLRRMQSEPVPPLPWQPLLHACREGTAEFAALARLAFAADAQLRSAVAREALRPERALQLRAASGGVASLLQELPSDHLRSGSFDITQPTWHNHAQARTARREPPLQNSALRFRLQPDETRRLGDLLHETGFALEPEAWVAHVMHASRAREWAKFVFSRHLSAALERIASAFAEVGLDRDCASWLSLRDIERAERLAAGNRPRYWQDRAELRRRRHQEQARVLLSPLLRSDTDRWFADSLGVLPNFVGRRPASGPLRALRSGFEPNTDLRGAIVLVTHADPGYDWLFERGISGLITAWGGAHSHMAIRCAEFGLAAAIGCGEAVHQRASVASRARIDPLSGSLWLD